MQKMLKYTKKPSSQFPNYATMYFLSNIPTMTAGIHLKTHNNMHTEQ